jgi:hypothetical protein
MDLLFGPWKENAHIYITAVQEWGKVFVDGNRRGLKREK